MSPINATKGDEWDVTNQWRAGWVRMYAVEIC
jgi:hypothetical protein